MRKIALILALLLAGTQVHAVKISDITRLGTQRPGKLAGLGLVVGLKGTGDGGDYAQAMKPLASMLTRFYDEATLQELANVTNVALVSVTATVPPNGVKAGDRIDVFVQSVGMASSLKGGRLFIVPMTLGLPPNAAPGRPAPDPQVVAFAEGPLVIEDASTPTCGLVRGGAIVDEHMIIPPFDKAGRFTLVLDTPSANWTNASTIGKIINDAEGTSGETLARVLDEKTVEVTIPQNERQQPDSFISRVQRLPVPMLPTEAVVEINEKIGSVFISGDVEISPVVISYEGLTISTITPPPVGTVRTPVVTDKTAIAIDTTNQGGARLQDLVAALDQLRVPARDRVLIIKELHNTGKIHARLKIAGE